MEIFHECFEFINESPKKVKVPQLSELIISESKINHTCLLFTNECIPMRPDVVWQLGFSMERKKFYVVCTCYIPLLEQHTYYLQCNENTDFFQKFQNEITQSSLDLMIELFYFRVYFAFEEKLLKFFLLIKEHPNEIELAHDEELIDHVFKRSPCICSLISELGKWSDIPFVKTAIQSLSNGFVSPVMESLRTEHIDCPNEVKELLIDELFTKKGIPWL